MKLSLNMVFVTLMLCSLPKVALAERDVLRVAYPLASFVDVDIAGAQAAMGIWLNALAEEWTLPFDVETVSYEDGDRMAEDLVAGELDLAVLMPRHYMQVKEQTAVEPVAYTRLESDILYKLVLLVRRDSEVKDWAGLAGKDLMVARAGRGALPQMWMEVRLAQQGLGRGPDFLNRISTVTKTSQAVLPVFLGRANACLVPQEQFEIMTELNPQLLHELKVLDVSPGIFHTVISLRSDLNTDYKELIRKHLVELGNEPLGQQIISLFAAEMPVPFDAQSALFTLELIGQYEKLQREKELMR